MHTTSTRFYLPNKSRLCSFAGESYLDILPRNDFQSMLKLRNPLNVDVR